MPGALSESDALSRPRRFGKLPRDDGLTSRKIVFVVAAVAVAAILALYVVGFVLFGLGETVPANGEGDVITTGSPP